MKIAICDDEAVAREEISALLETYIEDKKVGISYEVFEDYKTLCEREDEFDIFLVDYLMPGVNGLEFAKGLRERHGSRKFIIFITQYNEIVYDSFTVQTHRFLLKPVDKEKLYEALDSSLLPAAASGHISIRYGGNVTLVSVEDILYIEVSHKELYICTEKEQILCRRSISSVEDELAGYGFFRVHRSYLVNMRKVRTFNQKTIELNGDEILPISARKYSEFCREYLKMK